MVKHWTENPCTVVRFHFQEIGWLYIIKTILQLYITVIYNSNRIAQWLERASVKRKVVGSNPTPDLISNV